MSLPPPSLDQMIIAATRLVDAIVEYRRPNDTRISTTPKKEPEARSNPFTVLSMSDLVSTEQEVLHLRDIVSDPVVHALKTLLNELGQHIYDRVGSINELVKIGERIANAEPSQFSRRISPIENAWDGVGKGKDRWRA